MQETHSAWVVAAGVLLLGMGVVSYLYAIPQLIRSMVSEVATVVWTSSYRLPPRSMRIE